MVEVVHQGNVFLFAVLTVWLQFQLLRLNQGTKPTSSTIGLACNYTLIHLGREYHSIFYSYAICLHKLSATLYPSNVVEMQKSSFNALCLRRVRRTLALVVWHFKESLTTWLVNLARKKIVNTGMACHLFLWGCKSKGKALRSDLVVRLVDILPL